MQHIKEQPPRKSTLQVPIPLNSSLTLFPTYIHLDLNETQRNSMNPSLSRLTWSVDPESTIHRG